MQIDNQNYEGAIVKTLKNGSFILGHGSTIKLYSKKNKVQSTIEVEGVSIEDEIVSMDTSSDNKRLGVAFGKILSGADETITKFIVFAIKKGKNLG